MPAAGAIDSRGCSTQVASVATLQAANAVQPVVRVARGLKKPRKVPSWLVSLGFHGALIGLLGCIGIPGLQQSFDFSLTLSDDPGVVEEMAVDEIAIEPLAEVENVENQLATEVVQTSFTANELDAEAALADLSSTSLADAAVGDVAGLFGADGLSEVVPAGDKLTASFFGTKVDGRRILYVLDNSGGMQDGGFETLIDELLRSVESLSPEQEFYVIFYSDMVYPMFHPRAVERFVPASDRFKQRLKTWLDSVEFCVGNTVDEAIQAAAMIRPDAVYLLTDGNIDTTRDGRKTGGRVGYTGPRLPDSHFWHWHGRELQGGRESADGCRGQRGDVSCRRSHRRGREAPRKR